MIYYTTTILKVLYYTIFLIYMSKDTNNNLLFLCFLVSDF